MAGALATTAPEGGKFATAAGQPNPLTLTLTLALALTLTTALALLRTLTYPQSLPPVPTLALAPSLPLTRVTRASG